MNYEIIRSKRKTASIEIKSDGRIFVRVPNRMPQHQIDGMLERKKAWIQKHLAQIEDAKAKKHEEQQLSEDDIKRLISKAKQYIPARCELYANMLGVNYNRIAIRKQQTRWGSCSSKGNLNFNVLLMLTPIDVIDYVVIHELCHRKQMNHSKKFWDLVESVMPDYKEQRKWLNENGSRLMSMLPQKQDGNDVYYTYIVRCCDGTYYTGYTNDLNKRIEAHNSGTGAKYTKTRVPVELVYYETFEAKEDAMRREALIKQLTKRKKEELIKQMYKTN